MEFSKWLKDNNLPETAVSKENAFKMGQRYAMALIASAYGICTSYEDEDRAISRLESVSEQGE